MNVKRLLRILGTLMAVGGVLMLVWVVVVWRWQDPFTGIYTKWKQHQLAQSYDRRVESFSERRGGKRGAPPATTPPNPPPTAGRPGENPPRPAGRRPLR